MVGGIATLAAAIGEGLRGRLPARNKKQREGSAPLAATMLDARSANPMALAAAPPRAAERTDMRDQWISRLPGNGLIDVDAVMAPYGREILARLAAAGRRVVPMIDQTQATGRHQVVMAAAHGSAGVPCRWRGGSRRPGEPPAAPSSARLRRRWRACRPKEGVRPVPMGDRFYGTPDPMARCRARGWGWRPRPKRDRSVFEAGGGTTLAACFGRGGHLLSGIELTEKRVATDVAMVHEPGHPEPRIIAPSPNRPPPTAPSITA